MFKSVCWLDIVILLPILFGLVRGIMRGMIAELNGLLALALGIMGAKYWGLKLANWIQSISDWSMNICSTVSYIALFIVIAIALTLTGKALQKLLKKIKLDWINRLFGALCGTLKWAVIMMVIIFAVGNADTLFHFIPKELKQKSIIYQPALDNTNTIWKLV